MSDKGKIERPGAETSTREWVRSLVIVLGVALGLVFGGLILIVNLLGDCGSAYCR